MNAMLTSQEEYEPDFEVSFRESNAPGVPFELSPRSKYTTQARHARRRGNRAANFNGAHRRRDKRNGV